MRAKTVNEAQNFERGQNPKETMGIGNEEIQLVNRLDRLASKYGFEKVPLDPEDQEEGIIDIQRWFSNENECQIVLYKEENFYEDMSGYYINWEDLEGSGNDSAEQWLDEEEWESHYGEDAERY